jgi:hypothetical protein
MSKPGFVSWRVLIEGAPVGVTNHLRNAVRGLCHWEHARHVVADEQGYRALLKLWHLRGDDGDSARGRLIDAAFFPPVPLVRGAGGWLMADTLTPRGDEGLQMMLETLPAVRYIDDKGKTKHNRGRLGQFLGEGELTSFGYPAVTPLRGVDMADGARAFDDERVYVVVPARPPFKYRPAATRDMAAVEATIQRCFPAININLLRLLSQRRGLYSGGTFSTCRKSSSAAKVEVVRQCTRGLPRRLRATALKN